MSCMQHLGLTWPTLVERVEESGPWPRWVSAEPALESAGGLEEVAAIVADRNHPGDADALLAALVRLGAADGGNDQDAAGAVALLLANGADRLARRLRNLSEDIDQLVAAEVWLQIRQFPWRRRRRAIACNILMEARRVLLRDLGVDNRSGSRGTEVILVDPTADPVASTSNGSRARAGGDCARSGDDLTLLTVLQWATSNGVVTTGDATILLELAGVELTGAVRGLNSAAEINAVAMRRGVSERTIRRGRDRAVRSLAGARLAYLRDFA